MIQDYLIKQRRQCRYIHVATINHNCTRRALLFYYYIMSKWNQTDTNVKIPLSKIYNLPLYCSADCHFDILYRQQCVQNTSTAVASPESDPGYTQEMELRRRTFFITTLCGLNINHEDYLYFNIIFMNFDFSNYMCIDNISSSKFYTIIRPTRVWWRIYSLSRSINDFDP